MSKEKFRKNPFRVGESRCSGNVIIDTDISRTDREISVGECIKGKRKKSMAVYNKCPEVECLGIFFKTVQKSFANLVK